MVIVFKILMIADFVIVRLIDIIFLNLLAITLYYFCNHFFCASYIFILIKLNFTNKVCHVFVQLIQ